MKLRRLLPWMTLGVFACLSSLQAAATEVDAAGYYKMRCATCHGPGGEGTRDKSPSLGPPLRGNPFVINAPAEMLMSIIRYGRGGQQRVYDDAYPNMPAFDAGMVPDAMGLAIYLKSVLQEKEEATDKSEPVSQPPDEQVVVPRDAATRTDAGLVAPRHGDEASDDETRVPTRIPVSQ